MRVTCDIRIFKFLVKEFLLLNPTFIPVDIEDAVRRPFLNSLSKNLQYSLHIFEKVLETGWKTPFEQVDVTILSLYRKLLTQFDGIFILLDHG